MQQSLIRKFHKDQRGVAMMVFAIVLPFVLLVLAVAMNLNKVQGKRDGVGNAADSAASAVVDLLLKADLEDKTISATEIRKFALPIAKANVSHDNSNAIFLDNKFKVAVSASGVKVTACMLVKPNSLAAASGLSDEATVCSSSSVQVQCPNGGEWDGSSCAVDCNDPAKNRLVYEIRSVNPDAQSGPKDITLDVDVYKNQEKLRMSLGTGYGDTREGSCGYASGRWGPGKGEQITTNTTRRKRDHFRCNSVNRNYSGNVGSVIGQIETNTRAAAIYEPGLAVRDNLRIDGQNGSYITAKLKECTEEKTRPVVSFIYNRNSVVSTKPTITSSVGAAADIARKAPAGLKLCSCITRNKCGNRFTSKEDLGGRCYASETSQNPNSRGNTTQYTWYHIYKRQ